MNDRLRIFDRDPADPNARSREVEVEDYQVTDELADYLRKTAVTPNDFLMPQDSPAAENAFLKLRIALADYLQDTDEVNQTALCHAIEAVAVMAKRDDMIERLINRGRFDLPVDE